MIFDVVALGELLIDFIPYGKTNAGMDIFARNPGGAPGNVLVAASRLGLKTAFVGKVGNDIHGQYLKDMLEKEQVNTEGLSIDTDAFTTLAFVALSEMGERSFSFARKPGADTMLQINDIPKHIIEDCSIFHFGSLSLTDSPSKESTIYAVNKAKELGKIISYDPNFRPPLWKSYEQAQTEMRSVIKYVDIMKISDEELEIMTDETTIEAASDKLISQGASCIVITLGRNGAFLKNSNVSIKVDGISCSVLDTTGAGDAFWGGFLYKLINLGKIPKSLTQEDAIECLTFANRVAAKCVERYGAIPAMPSLKEMERGSIVNMKAFCTGLQHIGVPTDNIEKTILFYEEVGFEKVYETFNESANQKVAFLQLGTLIIETYEEENVTKADGAINHIAIDCCDIQKTYNIAKTKGFILLTEGIQSLDFWKNGIRYFIIEGPNKERLEFCQKL